MSNKMVNGNKRTRLWLNKKSNVERCRVNGLGSCDVLYVGLGSLGDGFRDLSFCYLANLLFRYTVQNLIKALDEWMCKYERLHEFELHDKLSYSRLNCPRPERDIPTKHQKRRLLTILFVVSGRLWTQ